MKKTILSLIMCMLSLLFISPIYAEETDRSFNTMLANLFTNDNSGIVVEMNEEDITEQFIDDFSLCYAQGNLDLIENYAADNQLMFILPSVIETRGVNTGTYTVPQFYVVFKGTSQINTSTQITLPALVSFRITCTYDFNTGLITGSVRTPTVLLEDTDGVADQIKASNVTYSGSIVNDGYTVRYTKITFTPMACNSGLWQTYNNYTYSKTINFTPYE